MLSCYIVQSVNHVYSNPWNLKCPRPWIELDTKDICEVEYLANLHDSRIINKYKFNCWLVIIRNLFYMAIELNFVAKFFVAYSAGCPSLQKRLWQFWLCQEQTHWRLAIKPRLKFHYVAETNLEQPWSVSVSICSSVVEFLTVTVEPLSSSETGASFLTTAVDNCFVKIDIFE